MNKKLKKIVEKAYLGSTREAIGLLVQVLNEEILERKRLEVELEKLKESLNV